MPKNFAQKHHFILAKFLKFQETFYKKFLVSGFGAEAPTYLSYKKGKPKNFHRTHHFISAKFLRFQRTFHEKPFGQGLGRTAPTFNAYKKS